MCTEHMMCEMHRTWLSPSLEEPAAEWPSCCSADITITKELFCQVAGARVDVDSRS